MNTENNNQCVNVKFCLNCGNQLLRNDKFCEKCGIQIDNNENFIKEKNQSTPSANHQCSTKEKSNKIIAPITINKMYIYPIIIGIVFILLGLFIQIPGGVLTTYESLNGDKAKDYVFDNKYSSIDEYVGGDAYNYIVGASLVAGKISGTITAKVIFVVGGALCLCIGIALKMLQSKKTTVENEENVD